MQFPSPRSKSSSWPGKTTVDPVTLVLVGGIAGVEQAQNDFSGYGQGAQGYGKRFGAGYADTITGTFIGSAILPSLLKQDPRYFLQGKRQQAITDSVRDCQCSDLQGRQWTLAAKLLEYPRELGRGRYFKSLLSSARSQWSGIDIRKRGPRIGASAAANLLQEFLIRKLTQKVPNDAPAKP